MPVDLRSWTISIQEAWKVEKGCKAHGKAPEMYLSGLDATGLYGRVGEGHVS